MNQSDPIERPRSTIHPSAAFPSRSRSRRREPQWLHKIKLDGLS
jgi:hypothetical protein